ncbi:Aureobasidin A1 biosynthesis complex [Pyrenophora teres f. teres]|uniref:Aureobasidin A1 biosynthesis complex n=1 Tax=Pyrenophora teres f. teres TaxID=97479 RepID=A0A6S6WLQ7_9PLEO|nr:Aureobasidin A1 biosynthesis complex [Pyrenophora teres f. teres]
MFTSGSTGMPKGVMAEHRGIVRLVRDNNLVQHLPDSPVMAHMANLAFDASTWEIYGTLLCGGTLVCIDAAMVLDAEACCNIPSIQYQNGLHRFALSSYTEQAPALTGLECCHLAGKFVMSTGLPRTRPSAHLLSAKNEQYTNGVPIGRALSNSGACHGFGLQLVPLGVVGELVVTGDGLARGYTDPARNIDRFVSVEIGGKTVRAYRTGDYVRHRPTDGQLEFFGRMDGQVKIRGNRVELGEVEHALRSDKAVREAVAVLQQHDGSEARLAGFVTVHEDAEIADEQDVESRKSRHLYSIKQRLTELLEAQLPAYMVPQTITILDAMPVNQNGKADRKALEQQIGTQEGQSGLKRQPETEMQRTMQQLWAGVLAIAPDSIGLDDSFFRLGGDSIAAMKLVGEARRAGIQLTVADLFRNPRLDQLTAAATASTHASPVSIPQVEHVGPVAQSFAQGRLWFLEELHPGLTWYLMPLAVRIRGPLDLPALHSALLAVERRHETLRTTFATVDGASVQVVQPFQAKDLNIIDIVPGDEQGLTEAVQQEQGTVFNLRTQPGWRVTVYRVGEHDHVLSIVMHHIISDGWSVDVLMRELAGFYSASVRGHDPLSQVQPLPVQYRDFSLWQRQQAQADEHQKQLSYWVEQLQTSRPAELLCDKPRPAALSGQAGVQSIEIAGPLYAKLQSFCQLHGVTQFVVLLAAFRTAHFRLTGQDDATIGTVNANRDRWEIKDMIGFFVNLQCLRITAGHGSFEELVQQVHEVTIASHANADVPFESIVSKLKSDRDLSRHPLVQLVRLGVSLFSSQTACGQLMFSTDLYAPETIDNLLSVFQRVLEACLDDPQAPVASMPLLREDNYAKLDAMGLVRAEETAYPRDSSVVDLFREQAAACPSRVAVKDSVTEMTYAQLDTASDVLARWLARRSLAPETLVGVFASRSCEAIVAFLGILKANLAYLPFDVKIPRKRMEDILSSLPGHRIILVGVGAQPPSTELSNIELVGIREALDEQTKTKAGKHTLAVCSGPSATSLAYVMFTSGSTGMPKGVMAEHRGIVRLVRDNNLVQHLPDSPVMAHMANLAFDASTWEIYSTLLRGGTLVCIGAAMVLDAEAVLQMFREHCIRTAYMAPSLFRSYILQAPALFTGLDMLCVGGEAVHPADLVAAKQYLTGKGAVRKRHSHRPRPQQLGAFVMDAKLQLVPLGVVGELVVTGDGLARGYTDPARNIDRFVSVEIGGKTVRAYRTGDYVRHRPTDGQLEFFGRMDGQVKIRGNRVELGEVEHALRSDKAVREAVAVLQQHDGSEARLAGFVTVHEDAETADEHVDDSNESQHVDVWEDKFDADIYSPIDNVQKENIGRDFVGWTSMYDGSDIDKAEMNEWLDDTIDTMLNGQRPGNVLEIGSGTGMILFNLGDGLQSYVGLDPSRKAVQFIAETAKSIPGLAGKIRMYKATAADVGRLEQPVAASLVVINSVVQYFPSLDYLFKTVQQLVELEGTRTLFFGDVRSYALHREFLATRAVHMAGDRATKADIRRMVADMERPAAGPGRPRRDPAQEMKATNELSCYRYAAVVHLTPRDGQARELAVREVADDRWIDFAERRLDRQSLLQQLHGLSTSPTIAVSNIPYSKTMVSRCLVRSLEGAEGETSDSPDWLASVHQQTQDCRSLSAAELVELAQEADCRVEISWSRQHSQQGGLDAIFHRYQPLTGERVMFRFPTDHAERPLHSLSSKPLRQQFLQKTQQRLVEMLEAQLPTYMVPQTLTVLDAMPVNPNGKVDRKALEQQADTQSNHSGQKQQPSTPAERAMQQLWAGVLAIAPDSIGLDDSFFRLGGDSIAAMKLVGEARRAGIQLTVADLFRNPRLDQLTAAATASTHASPVSIPQVEHVGPVAQSFAQGRLWFLEELHPGLTWYLMPLAVRIRGPLDLPALHSALLAVERRHETLRTTFATVDGASVQVVQPFQAKDLNIIDIVPGDEQGLRKQVTVYRVGEHDHVLSIVMHHIISDGWSVDVLMRELAGFYSASVRGHDPLSQVQPLPVQYRDFSLWQRQQAQADEHQKQLSYWVEQLQTSRPAELLCDKPRPAALSGQAGVQSIEIAGPLYAKLQSFCQLHGVTQFVVLLAAFRTAHFRLTGQDDATIGTVNANRDRWEIKDMIGFFVSMQCLRITIGDDSFEQLVQQVNAVAVASHANADVPFESIVSKLKSDRDLSRHPLVQLVFAVHAQRDLGQLKLEGMKTESLGDTATTRFDLEFHLFQQSDSLWGSVMFSTDLYAPETIDNLLSVFQRVLEACLDDPQAPVASMPLLREDNYAKLDAMGLVRAEETAYPRDSSVVDLFREQAAACPSRVAVKDSVTEMTYAQLDTASDVLARWLARRSLAPETLVGVFASRSCEAIVAFLGILKANLAYLPFDVKIPRKRMEDILSSLPGHRIILVGVGAQPPSTELSNIELVGIREALDEQTKTKAGKHTLAVCSGPSATSLAYVMFTSGSTGMPKGVMAEHRGIVRLVRDNNLVQHLPDSPVMAHMANLAFDASTWEIYGTLLCGGTLQSPALIARLEMVCVGGERMHEHDLVVAREHLPASSCMSTAYREHDLQHTFLVSKNEHTRMVPIGRALSNSGAYLVVTGDGLARGYTDPARNIDRFVSVEIGGKTVRAYRTGDYVRHRPTDGQLEFFGRMDGQVKIRGNRVELGEVEHALRSDKAVREAVAVLQQHDGSEARLAGFVTVHEDAEIADEQDVESRKSRHLYSIKQRLTELLEAQLPAYMVPQTITILDAMPVNQNGKADRKALEQQIGTQEGQSGLKRQPETEMQRTMQQLWAGVLAIAPDSIGLDDSFFRLGGDSIAAMKLVGEARRAGIQLTVADLFRNPRLDQLTAAATASTHASPVSIPQVEHVGPVAQSFAQGRLWFLEELHPGLTWYLMPLAVRIRGPLDLPALHSALLAVERRHETLRTTFATVDGASVQVVQPFQAKDLNIIDIVPGDEQGLTEAVHQDHSTPFDLRTQPGWRVTVYRVGEHDHVLSIVMHHIISDGWSVDVLMRELAGFYSASVRGHDPLSQVQPLPVQYRDFSLWQRQQAQADEHQKQLSYWVEQLQTSRPAELLCDKPRPAALSGQAGVQSIEIAGPLYAKLQSFCQLHGVTQFVVLLAAFRTAHFRLTGQDDATIGTVNANRDRWEIKDMIGFFVNLQCLRITAGHGSFEELVQQVHEVTIASHANADVPFESIVSKLKSDRDLSRHPLVQLVFAVHAQQDLGQLNLEGVQAESLADAKTSRFDLEFHFSQQPNGLWGSVMFSTDLYAPETIDNLLSVFQRVLEACLDDPQAPVASMPLLREDNYAKLDAMGLVRAEETAYPRDSSVVDLFREQAAACPSRVAVKDSVTEMTYAQLDTASDALARWLARRSLAPETLVGVFASRSCEAIVAFLGILKANLAYLPFDVKIPRKRMEDILSSLPGHRIILVGVGAQPPSTELSNIELVGIREALDEQTKTKAGKHTLAVCSGPSATSLAYVMFTSGSTGMPKGVMVEHRGIVRLVRDNNLQQHVPATPTMAHMTNLAFDPSILEIYTCLLNAGTLVCIDTETVLDATAVLQTFRQSSIRSAIMAPSLFRMYLAEAPGLYSELHMLCVGGEALHTNDLIAARHHLTGVLVNAYGPTENGVVSTIAIVLKDHQYSNGIPIGRALSNSGAFVMDAKLQLVPLGVVGELVVTGDGLARGYTDPARNIDRFVSVEIGGKTVRAYRTGDYVRHRPTDGQLEFFGRMDGQVKIRGNRVELGEVEHALRSDKAVREAVAVLQQHDGSEARLAGFVTVHEDAETADEHVDDSNESQHVDVWEDKFDADIYSPIDNVQKENIGRDFVGWTSMYDGSDIDKAEMNEWLDDTIDTMLNGQRPGNVLEIGSGTGMILFNLGDGLQSYVGLDPSRKAVQFIAETAKSIPGLAGKIRMYKATAADVGRLEQPVAASLVVINSVVQYFPSLDYLFKTVQQLVELEGTRTLFFGDVRSYALHREFLATRAVHMAGDRATKADIRRMVADMERVERELLVDPAFFTALPSRLPGLVDHVEILPKRMKATNELSCYRYAAVVHLTPRDGQARELAVREVADDRWIDFAERRLDRQSLLQQLHGLSTSPTIAVSNIPYSKTMVSRCLVRSLEGAEGETSDSPDWLASVHQQTQDCRSLSAAELVELAQEADCRVEISWSRQHSQQGGLDAIFHRYQPLTGERVMFRFPTDHAERPLHSLSSKPLRQQFLQKTQQRLVEMLEAQLPTYMVPQTLTVLDAMPVNPNGKVDRKALEQQADTQSNHSGQKQQPSTPAERAMQQLWAGVLAIAPDSIGLDDSFFRLGGDSIVAMKLVGEARKAGMHLTVADVFMHPILQDLARNCRKVNDCAVELLLPFSLLSPATKEDILSTQQSLDTTMDVDIIVDILPVTHSQKIYLCRGLDDPRVAFNHFYVDIGPQLDLELLRYSCRKLVDHFSILRSKFVPHKQEWFQIVLRTLELPFSVFDVDQSMDEASHAMCMQDIKRTDPLEVPTSFKLLRNKSETSRLIVRLSHAQYDGVCLPVILQTLVSIYQQEPLYPAVEFSSYLAHARRMRTISSRYWRELLKGSFPTRAVEKLSFEVQEPVAPRLVYVERYIDAPRHPERLTMASLLSSAWALVLASITGEQDVVFGHVVAGRNSDIPNVTEIIGPCLNIIPVRTLVHPTKTSKELTQSVQDQHISLGQSDSMGWDEIVQDCTDWPAGTMFDSVVQHQNIVAQPEIHFAGATAKLNGFKNSFGVAPYLTLFSEPQGNQLKIMISGNTHFLTLERASLLVDMLGQAAQALSYSPQASLASLTLSLPNSVLSD